MKLRSLGCDISSKCDFQEDQYDFHMHKQGFFSAYKQTTNICKQPNTQGKLLDISTFTPKNLDNMINKLAYSAR